MNVDIHFESIMEMQNVFIYTVWLRRTISIPLWKVIVLWWGGVKLMRDLASGWHSEVTQWGKLKEQKRNNWDPFIDNMREIMLGNIFHALIFFPQKELLRQKKKREMIEEQVNSQKNDRKLDSSKGNGQIRNPSSKYFETFRSMEIRYATLCLHLLFCLSLMTSNSLLKIIMLINI